VNALQEIRLFGGVRYPPIVKELVGGLIRDFAALAAHRVNQSNRSVS
jgi:hypothetical protein